MITKQYKEYGKVLDFRIFHGFYLDLYKMDQSLSRFVQLSDLDKAARLEAQPYDLHQDFHMVPIRNTEIQMQNLKMRFRKNSKGFFVAAKVITTEFDNTSPSQHMFIQAEQPFSLSFGLFIRNPYFLNFSDLELTDFKQHTYFFSNRASVGGSGANIGIGQFDHQPVDQNSRLPLLGSTYRHTFDASEAITQAKFTVSDAFSQDLLLEEQVTASSSPILESHSLDLSGLADGLLNIKLEKLVPAGSPETIEVYKYTAPPFRSPFALIELHFLTTESTFFEQPDGALKSPTLNLYVDNRKTKWRYYNGMKPTEMVTASTDKKPLTRHGYSAIEHLGKALPNPSAKVLTAEADGYYSDTFL